MLSHVRKKHGFSHLPSMLVITNQCPWCMSTFASAAGARAHVRRAVQSGRCLADRAAWSHAVR
eukprot:8345583-Lingulodinium_polyedra.AAC.1